MPIMFKNSSVKHASIDKEATSLSSLTAGGVPAGFPLAGGAQGAIGRLSPSMRNPLLNTTNFYLPQDRRVLNQWYRYYDKFSAFVGNSLDLHAQTVVSPCRPVVADKKVQRVYDETWEALDLVNNTRDIVREYFLIGEVFPFLQWDETKGIFSVLTVIDPDLVTIKYHPFMHIDDAVSFEIEPPPQLQEFVSSSDYYDQKLTRMLPQAVLNAVETGSPIRAVPFNMTAILRKSSPYDQRGTSIVLRCLKYLMYADKLMESNYAIAEGHVMPRWIFKLGDASKGIVPRASDLKAFRDQLMRTWFDKNTAIVSTYALTAEAIGSSGAILPLVPEYEWVQEMVLTALFTTKLATTGEGPTYQNSSVAREMVNARYNAIRNHVCEQWWTRKIFTPIAKAHGFYRPEDKDLPKEQRRLLLPEYVWDGKLDLTDTQEFRDFLFRLRDMTAVSMETVYKSLGLDYSKEEEKIKKEFGSVFDPAWRQYREDRAKAKYQKKIEEITGETPDEGLGEYPGETESLSEFPSEDSGSESTSPESLASESSPAESSNS